MQNPGQWLYLQLPPCTDLTCAAQNIRGLNTYSRFYSTYGTSYKRVYCVAWSQDQSFYCCPRDVECDPASGWNKTHEAFELYSRRLQAMYDDFYGYF